jgi:hypothetical protein
MAALPELREAARLVGVSPGRLYRAIATGRLTAAPGGGPGKPTLVSLEAVHKHGHDVLYVGGELRRLARARPVSCHRNPRQNFRDVYGLLI